MDSSKCWYKKVCEFSNTDYCGNHCVRFLEMKALLEQSNLPESKWFPKKLFVQEVDREAYKKLNDIKSDILNFVRDGRQLYIESKYPGNGKTTWAIKILLKYFNDVWNGNGLQMRGVFISVPLFINQLKNNIDKKDESLVELKHNIETADIVVWDDISSTLSSTYDYNQISTYIEMRLLQDKCNIFTSNIEGEKEVYKVLGYRLASRIYNGATVVTLRGLDMRDLNKGEES
ncbi:MAG: hypothetical protein HUJ56_06015 [Erysipelotrichaceae bacterium]|nr:hypothetical protein [Erysipelotrichaceae bacterium]